MQKINDGGPAFPTNRVNMHGEVVPDEEGMTLRDYFAAKAMQGFCGRGHAMPAAAEHYMNLAEDSYRMADAMLKERSK